MLEDNTWDRTMDAKTTAASPGYGRDTEKQSGTEQPNLGE